MRKTTIPTVMFVAASTLCSSHLKAECFYIDSEDCANAPADLPVCSDTDCTESVLFPGQYYCPSETEGCRNEETDHYDGYASGWGPFSGFNYGDEVVCVSCGPCNGCTTLAHDCKEDDPENWEPQEVLYHLEGIGTCL